MPRNVVRDGRIRVRVSNAGQVSIPKPFRDAMGLEQGTVLEVEAIRGQLVFTPKVLTDWEGRQAYVAAKRERRAGRLQGPFDAKKADARLALLSRKVSKRVSKKP